MKMRLWKRVNRARTLLFDVRLDDRHVVVGEWGELLGGRENPHRRDRGHLHHYLWERTQGCVWCVSFGAPSAGHDEMPRELRVKNFGVRLVKLTAYTPSKLLLLLP